MPKSYSKTTRSRSFKSESFLDSRAQSLPPRAPTALARSLPETCRAIRNLFLVLSAFSRLSSRRWGSLIPHSWQTSQTVERCWKATRGRHSWIIPWGILIRPLQVLSAVVSWSRRGTLLWPSRTRRGTHSLVVTPLSWLGIHRNCREFCTIRLKIRVNVRILLGGSRRWDLEQEISRISSKISSSTKT